MVRLIVLLRHIRRAELALRPVNGKVRADTGARGLAESSVLVHVVLRLGVGARLLVETGLVAQGLAVGIDVLLAEARLLGLNGLMGLLRRIWLIGPSRATRPLGSWWWEHWTVVLIGSVGEEEALTVYATHQIKVPL